METFKKNIKIIALLFVGALILMEPQILTVGIALIFGASILAIPIVFVLLIIKLIFIL